MNILLTGCSKGIGKALLTQLLNEGHEVITISRTKTEFENALPIPYSKWQEITGDILNPETHDILDSMLQKWDHLDAVINNAGFLISKDFETLNYEDVKKSFDVNFYAPLKITQICIPYLKKAQNASHINIGSIGGVQGSIKFPGLAAYSSSKGALAILTECLAEEYKESAIHFNCLALGAVQTEMLAQAFPGYIAPFNPEQMADYIINFIIKASPMMNGKIISVSASTP